MIPAKDSRPYQVNEIFTTLQGEGVHSGKSATFIRLQGCPVKCEWCDTKYTWDKGGTSMTLDEIAPQISPIVPIAVITGGEPMLYDLDALYRLLHFGLGKSVQVETSGYCGYKGLLRADWLTWSPKPKLDWKCDEGLWQWVNEVKWVIDKEISFETILAEWDHQISVYDRKPAHFVLMPEGCPPGKEMIDKAIEFLFRAPIRGNAWWRISDRLQYRLGVK